MSLDTKYRPSKYADVLGQEGTVTVFRQFVSTGAGCHQSYLLAGPRGCGKTTLARVLGRALLCDNPVNGDPCDSCPSCRALLEDGVVSGFVEVDAANNSGKDSMKKVTEEIQYATFSGRRRIYLFDEAHNLSKEALDAMLKPMEENVPGTEDKRLVCIFCTTEPEKMKATILSRCAPTFTIRQVAPGVIAERLARICDAEGIEYEKEALTLVAEITGCHIREALKAVEGVALLGGVTRANVDSYLHLDLHTVYLAVLENIGADLPEALRAAEAAMQRVSPVVCYERLAEAAMLAFKTHMGVMKPPAYWDEARVRALGERLGDGLLVLAQRFASRPGHPSSAMLLCDIAAIHKFGMTAAPDTRMPPVQMVQVSAPVPSPTVTSTSTETSPAPGSPPEKRAEAAPPTSTPRAEPQVPRTSPAKTSSEGGRLAKAPLTLEVTGGVYVDPRGLGHREDVVADTFGATGTKAPATLALSAEKFAWLLGLHIASLDEAERGGLPGRPDVDRR